MNTKIARLNLLFGISVLLSALFASSAFAQDKRGQVVNSGQIETRTGTVQAQFPPPKSTEFKTPPDPQPIKKVKPLSEVIRLDPPVDPSARPEDIRPMNEPTIVKTQSDSAPLAPGTFTAFRNTALPSAPVVSGVTLNGFIPIEPSVAKNGRVVFYTTNSYNGISGDGGQTFTFINPFDYFPANGTNDPIDGGFGGDQYVLYERTRGLMFWLLQYRNTATTNRQRLCVSRSQNDVLNGACPFFYDFSPANFSIPTPAGAAGTWMDFPDMAVSDGFLYLSSNVFCTSGCTGNGSRGAVMWRISLNELLQQSGSINFGFTYDAGLTGFRFTQGARGTMYWGSHVNTGQIRIYRWPDTGGIAFDDVNHTAYNLPPACVPPNVPPACGIMRANSPDGTNFAGSADSRLQGAWVAGGVIGFMFTAAQGGAFTFPHVQVLRFNESNRTLLPGGQTQVFSNSIAFMYPSVQPNERGHLGGTMAWGGGTSFPNALAWIADDFNNNTIAPLENITFAAGTAGPCDPNFDPVPMNGTLDCYNRWGDYLSTRISVPYSNTWIGTGFVLTGANGVTREPHYVNFGRERDTPPASNVIFVSLFNTSGYEDGSILHPYNTLREGHFASVAGDTISIVPANYNEPQVLNRPSRLERFGNSGTVHIGP